MPLASIACPGRLDAHVARPGPRWKEPPLADAGHQFEPPLGQPQPPVERLQPLLEFRRRHDLVRQRVTERLQANATVVHGLIRAGADGAGQDRQIRNLEPLSITDADRLVNRRYRTGKKHN